MEEINVNVENNVLPDGNHVDVENNAEENNVEVQPVVQVELQDMAQAPAIQMPNFHGNPGERGDEWLAWYVNYAEAMSFSDNKRRLLLPFFFRDHAKLWYDALPGDTKNNWDTITAQFKTRFNGSDGVNNDVAILNIKQNADESCASYFTRFTRATTNKEIPQSILVGVVMNGLRPSIKQIVMPQDPKTVEEVRKLACLGERTLSETAAAPVAVTDSSVTFLAQKLEEVMALNAELRQEMRSRDNSYQNWSQRRYQRQQQQDQQWRNQHQQSRQPQQQQQPRQRTDPDKCGRCAGRPFHSFENCPAYNQVCRYCGKLNHFKIECGKRKRDQARNK